MSEILVLNSLLFLAHMLIAVAAVATALGVWVSLQKRPKPVPVRIQHKTRSYFGAGLSAMELRCIARSGFNPDVSSRGPPGRDPEAPEFPAPRLS